MPRQTSPSALGYFATISSPARGSARLPRRRGPALLLALAALLALSGCAPAASPAPSIQSPAREAAPTAAPAKPATEKAAVVPPSTAAVAAKPGPDEQALADFYRDKSIRLIVGHGAGGGFDTYSRVIARHLGKHIPGAPNIIVENMDGAGGLVAANHVYNQAPRDGTAVANIIGGIVRSQVLGESGIEFDAARFHYLGVPVAAHSVLMVTKASGVTRFDELIGPHARQVVLGDGGIATTNHNAAVLTRDVLNANIKVVTGYGTTAKVELAMDQGELDGQFNDWESNKARTPQKFEAGDWLLIGQLTDVPYAGLPGQVPMVLDAATTDEQRQLLRYGIIVPNRFTRLYFLPPEVPAARAAALDKAFAETMVDQEFLADAAKAKLDIEPAPGTEIQRLVQEYLSMSPDLREKLAQLLPRS